MTPVLNVSGYERVKHDMVRGEGCYLYDAAGRSYLDLEAGVWCAGLGHNHPRVNRALRRQMDQGVAHIGYRYTTAVEAAAAAALLGALNLPDGRCVFLGSGSEAVEFSLQAARCATRRPLQLTLTDTYLAAFGLAGRRRCEDWNCLDWRDCIGCRRDDCSTGCHRLAPIPWDKVGVFVFEPGSSSGRVRFPPKPLVQTLARAVQDRGGVVAVDEVTTGLGRTGAWFGFEHYGLAPDLVAAGKGLGNGYPVSAVAMTADMGETLLARGFHYAQSHQNDPMGCAVAMAVIHAVEEEKLVDRCRRTGAHFLRGLEAIRARHTMVRDVRGRGLMLAVELAPGSATDVYRALLGRGILAGCKPEADLLRFYPPLILTEKEIDRFLDNLDGVLDDIESGTGG
jgi:4-aminobutyrate aminotransferase-like enzyme